MAFYSSSTFRENILSILTGTSIAIPANNDVYISLGAGIISSTGSGFNELSSGGYARKQYSIGTSYFSDPVNRSTFNTQPFEFSTATAAWSLTVSVGVQDAATGTDFYYAGTLDLSRSINTNDRLYFPSGALVLTEKNVEGKTKKSNALANAILGIFRQQSMEPLSNLFLAFGSTLPDYQAETIGELTGKGYARIPIVCNTTNFAVSNRTATNQVEFVAQASTDDWLPIKSFALYKTLTGGASDLLWYGELSKDAVIFKQDKLIVPVGALAITE